MSERPLPSWFAWVVAFALVGGPLGFIWLSASGYPALTIAWAVFVVAVSAICYRVAIRAH